MFLCVFDPAVWALVGVALGGLFGIAGIIITVRNNVKTQKTSFDRSVIQQKINDAKEAYQSILKVIFILRYEGLIQDNRKLIGEMIGTFLIFSSDELKKKHLKDLQSVNMDDPVISSITSLMEKHIKQLESEL